MSEAEYRNLLWKNDTSSVEIRPGVHREPGHRLHPVILYAHTTVQDSREFAVLDKVTPSFRSERHQFGRDPAWSPPRTRTSAASCYPICSHYCPRQSGIRCSGQGNSFIPIGTTPVRSRSGLESTENPDIGCILLSYMLTLLSKTVGNSLFWTR